MYVCIYIYIYIYIYINIYNGDKCSTTHRVLKYHRSKMRILFMLLWKLPVNYVPSR